MRHRAYLMIVSIVGILLFPYRPVMCGQAIEDCKDCTYAINLVSSHRKFTVNDLPNRDLLLPYRVYTISFVTNGETWNRLRAGFFDSRESANTVLHRLTADYPGAWVAAVTESEKIGASKTAIEVNDPLTVAVLENASEPARDDATLPAIFDSENASPDLEASPPPQKLALAGAEYGSKNAYYYAGLLVPFPGSDLGNGLVQRYWTDWLYYEYEDWDHTVKAKAPGASIAAGYGKSTATGNWHVYVGPVWRHTNLTPDEPDSDVRGTQWGVNGSLEGDRRIGKNWLANGIASFTTGSASYWTRGRLIRRLESGPGMGVELVFHGNDDYSAWQTGLVLLDLHPAPHTSLGFKGGIRKSSGEDVGAYAGIELGKLF